MPRFACDYRSRAMLPTAEGNEHVVIAIDDENRRNNIAVTPKKARAIAESLIAMADSAEGRKSADQAGQP